ncbi:acyl transferase/acyl hydrolase/lysophospholipase [Xylogone sp. PMI_703]|nr:acyl transferase/acyl hydrolase/lysophospholipase [Xylogone sp. PMI_703]
MEQWKAAAKELDELEGNRSWKQDNTFDGFDAELIETRLRELDTARINCDVKAMLHLVRTALSRNLGGMGNIALYKHSHIGTKDLIERYIDSTVDTIRALVETSKQALPEGLEMKDIMEQVLYARQAFGRSALLLSGGATFGMNHIGVLKTLYEAKLLPRIISGASAGSIVCAVLCTRTDEELPAVLENFPYADLAVFEEDGREDGILERLRRLLTQGAWIDIRHLTRVMRDWLGDMTFQEAYNRSRRILNICVSSASVYELPRLLNYITAPNVIIWSAVAASCSVPVLFSSAQLLAKNPLNGEISPWNPTPHRWIDGSVDNDLPMTRLAEMFNVNHFIVSQVNPHVVPFLAKEDVNLSQDAPADGSNPGWAYSLTNLAREEALHRMQMLAELGIFPNLVTKLRSVLSQKYSGDITILPEIDFRNLPRMLKNPTPDFMLQACLSGERATWPKLSRIRNHCAVELELDRAVQALRARVVFSPSQVDLRRLHAGDRTSNALKSGGRKRQVSTSSLRLRFFSGQNDEDSEEERKDKKDTGPKARPRLRSSNSSYDSTHITLSQVSQTPKHLAPPPAPTDLPPKIPDISYHLHPYDPSSTGETSLSPPTSDADIDSHTDDSSPEPDIPDYHTTYSSIYLPASRPRRLSLTPSVDIFSSSQPVTSSIDPLLATTPKAQLSPSITRAKLAARSSENLSPDDARSSPSRTRTGLVDGGRRKSMSMSTPERRYRQLFHLHSKDEDEEGSYED